MTIKAIQAQLKKEKLSAAFFFNLDSIGGIDTDLLYLSGYDGPGAMIVTPKKHYLLVPKMELERARVTHKTSTYAWEKKRLLESIKGYNQKFAIRPQTVGINFNAVSLALNKALKKEFKGIRWKHFATAKSREVKSASEINTIKEACALADTILQSAIRRFSSFRTESEAAAFLECEARKLGHKLSFSPIVASGKHASMAHYAPQNMPIQKGFCIIDFGIRYKGYCSDMTRTIYVGKPTRKEIETYNSILKIQEGAVKMCTPCTTCQDVYQFVAAELGVQAKYFTHGLGHGVGIGLHELPNLVPNNKEKLKENSIVTVEPGIYIPGKWGIRIEDDVLVRGKPIILNRTTRKLITV
ncbi:TPA: M24 family metallopeptidase [Candidatus Woesearchaeota archaeon]|nr:M24 family metallopeptidase [Candidatus Woesearchaeota archaeon]